MALCGFGAVTHKYSYFISHATSIKLRKITVMKKLMQDTNL